MLYNIKKQCDMELSQKNTKTEILDAYEKLLKEVQQAKSNAPKQIQEEKKNKEIVDKVSTMTDDSILKGVQDLKISISSTLDGLSDKLLSEYKKLEEVRSAIEVEKKNLEELYSLNSTTDSLATMLLAYQEKKTLFDKEKETQISQWEAEKQQHKVSEKEYVDELQKARKREEEEYLYNLKKSRQKEADDYSIKKLTLEKEMEEKKSSFEKEIAQRQTELKATETELAELRKMRDDFPVKMENALKEKEKAISQTLEAKFEFERQLTQKQNELDNSLKDQNIKLLQEKVAELSAQLKEYSNKAAKAEESVKDIALKAIESSTKVQMITKAGREE